MRGAHRLLGDSAAEAPSSFLRAPPMQMRPRTLESPAPKGMDPQQTPHLSTGHDPTPLSKEAKGIQTFTSSHDKEKGIFQEGPFPSEVS